MVLYSFLPLKHLDFSFESYTSAFTLLIAPPPPFKELLAETPHLLTNVSPTFIIKENCGLEHFMKNKMQWLLVWGSRKKCGSNPKKKEK